MQGLQQLTQLSKTSPLPSFPDSHCLFPCSERHLLWVTLEPHSLSVRACSFAVWQVYCWLNEFPKGHRSWGHPTHIWWWWWGQRKSSRPELSLRWWQLDGWLLSPGLLPAQIIFGEKRLKKKIRKWFLLCGMESSCRGGNILSGCAWTVYKVFQTARISTAYSTQFWKWPATPQTRFTVGFSTLPTAASILSIYPSGTRLKISYTRFKAAGFGILEAQYYGWSPIPNANSVTGQQILFLHDVFNPTQRHEKMLERRSFKNKHFSK